MSILTIEGEKRKLANLEPTLCPNIIVLAVSPLCRGEGPIVMTSEVLAVPVKTFRSQETNSALIWFVKIKDD